MMKHTLEHRIFCTRGGHNDARARHWCGSRKIPLIMFGF